jgi:hypothetical protein
MPHAFLPLSPSFLPPFLPFSVFLAFSYPVLNPPPSTLSYVLKVSEDRSKEVPPKETVNTTMTLNAQLHQDVKIYKQDHHLLHQAATQIQAYVRGSISRLFPQAQTRAVVTATPPPISLPKLPLVVTTSQALEPPKEVSPVKETAHPLVPKLQQKKNPGNEPKPEQALGAEDSRIHLHCHAPLLTNFTSVKLLLTTSTATSAYHYCHPPPCYHYHHRHHSTIIRIGTNLCVFSLLLIEQSKVLTNARTLAHQIGRRLQCESRQDRQIHIQQMTR